VKRISAFFLLAFAVLLTIPAYRAAAQAATATAELRNPDGQEVGTATLTQQASGVAVSVQARNLPAGQHGVHIHETGTCTGPDFTSAGGHFNPGGRQHGLQNPQGAHAGDLPNLTIGQDGAGSLNAMATQATLAGGANSLLKTGGTALVIHAAADDERTDPTGNSGGRIACGVITAASSGATGVARVGTGGFDFEGLPGGVGLAVLAIMLVLTGGMLLRRRA
jgi:Cu-Zn family superoxide dismutase